MTTPIPAATTGALSPRLVLLLALSGGIAVGNLYWAQPLLNTIAASFGTSASAAGTLITATQLGYALGVLLLVPLGDTCNRCKLIPLLMLCSSAALAASALAPGFGFLLAALSLVGISTVAGQLITPLASELAAPAERGKIVGTIVSGMLTGILLSRTISGFLAEWLGWRSIYFCAAALTAALALVLYRRLPDDAARPRISLPRLLASIVTLVRQSRAVQVTLLLGFAAFATFTLFWTGLTFLLSAPPWSYSLSQIGLVGLVGLAGALIARRAGWLHDRGYSVPASGAALLLAIVSLAVSAAGAGNILLILAAVLFFDIAIQALNVLNQTRLMALNPDNRSRINTAFVTCNFVGGAVGSALAGTLWQTGGWMLLMAAAMVLLSAAFCVWFFQRNRL